MRNNGKKVRMGNRNGKTKKKSEPGSQRPNHNPKPPHTPKKQLFRRPTNHASSTDSLETPGERPRGKKELEGVVMG